MEYMYETQKSTLEHITSLTPYRTGQYMVIDTSTRRNLELVETMRENRRGALFCGFLTGQRQPWAPGCCEAISSSR